MEVLVDTSEFQETIFPDIFPSLGRFRCREQSTRFKGLHRGYRIAVSKLQIPSLMERFGDGEDEVQEYGKCNIILI